MTLKLTVSDTAGNAKPAEAHVDIPFVPAIAAAPYILTPNGDGIRADRPRSVRRL